jgi:hypothetical protein
MSSFFSSRLGSACKVQSSAQTRRRQSALDGKEFVTIVTRDGVRNLLVPSKKPNTYDEFWPERELERLQGKAKVLTLDSQMRQLQERMEDSRKLKEESEMRKQRLRDIDLAKDAKMEEQVDSYQIAENETKLKLLDRAYMAKQEQVRGKFWKLFEMKMAL